MMCNDCRQQPETILILAKRFLNVTLAVVVVDVYIMEGFIIALPVKYVCPRITVPARSVIPVILLLLQDFANRFRRIKWKTMITVIENEKFDDALFIMTGRSRIVSYIF